jgi:hypothetical protein
MPLPKNSIGSNDFLSLAGDPAALRASVELHMRGGVDGLTIARMGKRGAKFTLQSKVDQQDLQTARATFFSNYLVLIGANPVKLLWRDLDMSGEGYNVAVLDVRPVRIARQIISAGGFSGSNYLGAILICDWDLVAVATG